MASSESSEEQQQQLFEELETKSKERIDKQDYHRQIDRWNEYQNVLDRIEGIFVSNRAVNLNKHISHNMKTFRDGTWMNDFTSGTVLIMCFGTVVFGLMIAGLCFAPTIAYEIQQGTALKHEGIYTLLITIPLGVYLGREALVRVPAFAPKILVFKCAPKIHIDEMQYARQKIKGIENTKHDPTVKLPVIEMRIPRAWFAQQALLESMDSLKYIDLPRGLRQSF